MAEITFFRQQRADGGLRTGIEVDNMLAFEDYQSGGEEFDPTLLWYIDVRCRGESLPTDPDEARRWLLEQSPAIRSKLLEVADALSLGFDVEHRPYLGHATPLSNGSTLQVAASAIRRIESRQVSTHLRQIEANWDNLLRDLAPLAEV